LVGAGEIEGGVGGGMGMDMAVGVAVGAGMGLSETVKLLFNIFWFHKNFFFEKKIQLLTVSQSVRE
jgi:hypothetical protein